MYNNNNNLADDYADEGIIYTGKAINENLKNLSQSFNVLMRQMNLQEQEIWEREEIFDVECVCEWREWRERERERPQISKYKTCEKNYKTFFI